MLKIPQFDYENGISLKNIGVSLCDYWLMLKMAYFDTLSSLELIWNDISLLCFEIFNMTVYKGYLDHLMNLSYGAYMLLFLFDTHHLGPI